MLMSVRWRAVLLGLGVGVLILAAGAIVAWLVLSAVGFADAAGAATVVGALVGLGGAGWTAGRRAPYSEWFHGSIAGLAVAGVIVVTSILGGSPAPIPQVILLAFLGMLLGGIGGSMGGRRPQGGPRRGGPQQ